jgi:hypothetical protein
MCSLSDHYLRDRHDDAFFSCTVGVNEKMIIRNNWSISFNCKLISCDSEFICRIAYLDFSTAISLIFCHEKPGPFMCSDVRILIWMNPDPLNCFVFGVFIPCR